MVAGPEKPGLARLVDPQGCHVHWGRVTLEGFLDMVSGTQEYIINGLIRMGVGHSTAEHVTASFL